MQALGFETSGPSNFHQTASNMYRRPPLLCPYSTFDTDPEYGLHAARHIQKSKELESFGTLNAAKSHVVKTYGRAATDGIYT